MPTAIVREAIPRNVTIVMALMGLTILAASIYRAAAASFTHDEAFSYNHYITLSYVEILSHTHAFTNNHLLNTLGMKLCDQLFGSSEIALRLPNLLALALFLYYAARLLLKLPPWIAIGGFVVLGTNSFMLELFTLARGYGISFGFMLMALFHLVRSVQKGRLRDIVLFHLASVLATLGNFTLLNVHLAGLVTLYIVLIARVALGDVPRKYLVPVTITNAAMLAISTAVLWMPIRHTLEQNTLDFGGKSGFFSSTVSTWVMSLFPTLHIVEPVMIGFYIMIVLITLCALGASIRRFIRGDVAFLTQWTTLPVVAFVLTLTCLFMEIQHFLFGVDRLIGRFALFLLPLLVLLIVEILALQHARGWKKATSTGMALAALWSAISCSRSFGPYHSVEWQYDVRTKDVVAAIAMDMNASDHHGPPVHVGVNWLFEPTMNFYRIQMGLEEIQPLDKNGETGADTYRVEFGFVEDPIIADGYRRMQAFPESGVVLLKKVDGHVQPNSHDGVKP